MEVPLIHVIVRTSPIFHSSKNHHLFNHSSVIGHFVVSEANFQTLEFCFMNVTGIRLHKSIFLLLLPFSLGKQAGSVAQWLSRCLACVRPLV